MKKPRYKGRRRAAALVVAVALPAVFLFVPVYAAVVSNGRSVSTGLYEMFVYLTCNGSWWKWIAEKIASYVQ